MRRKRIAIIGAGPIGLEAALLGRELGHDVSVLERGCVGDNIAQWGHVRLFSAFALNHSSRGVRLLKADGVAVPAEDDYLTGREYLEHYLAPLARTDLLSGCIRERARVVSIGRDGIGKRDLIGGPRDAHRFRLLVEKDGGEESLVEADVVLDCSGTYRHHNWLGNGNVAALGERGLADAIAYEIPDVTGRDHARFEGKTVLLVGAGHSAATALDGFTRLSGTTVHWVARKTRPMEVIPDDPLPERARLAGLANRLAAAEDPAVRFYAGRSVEAVRRRNTGFSVDLSMGEARETVDVDEVLALVGYHPDNAIYRELQVHECYASLAPMKLAAKLLGESSADCLAQTSGGIDVLRSPEPNFFILGAKSYGKGSNFLIRTGVEQVEEVFSAIGAERRTERAS